MPARKRTEVWKTPLVPRPNRLAFNLLSCKGMKVLIVDDIQDYLEALGRALSGDYEVILAGSMDEAKARFSKEINLALVDVRLSESDRSNRDGLALLEWIRSASLTPQSS